MKEVISAHLCLECGHVITDHHRAGTGWHNGNLQHAKHAGKRDGCIGDRGTCPCKRFTQPHEFTRTSVNVQGLKA